VYLPIMRQISAGSLRVLDLACGRGEWLELLRGQGWQAEGVDTNRVLVDRCLARGLAVTENDALAHLRTVPAASLAAVTAFHLAEHLGFEDLVEIIDEAARALCPGGVLIVETPDPQNLRVAAYTFYCDPTHRHPLPSPLLKFIVEARGLRDVRVLPLHPSDTAETAGTRAAAPVGESFEGPQDYAIVGWKE
jgi:O-antigen chain-terminating methyltransferase